MSLVLKELEIIKHPLLKTDGKLTFSDDINLLIGKNGSGKTRLLELINMCLSFNFSSVSKAEFEIKYLLNAGDFKFSVHYSQSQGPVLDGDLSIQKNKVLTNLGIKEEKILEETIKVDFCLLEFYSASEKTVLEYNGLSSLNFVRGDEKEIFDFSPSTSTIIPTMVIKAFTHKYANEPPELQDSLYNLLYSTVNQSEVFLEDNNYYDKFFSKSFEASRMHEMLVNSIEKDFSIHGPELFTSRLKKTLGQNNEVDDSFFENLRIECSDNKFLRQLSESLGYNSISLKTQEPLKSQSAIALTSSKDGIVFSWNLKNTEIRIKIDKSTTIDYESLSYGEKRFFLLMLYIYENETLLMDEPINGLHHSMIRDFMNKLKAEKKQAFITNQSPLLFDYIDFDDKGSTIDQITICKKKDDKLVCSNPDEAVASAFYDDYEDEFLQVHEILKNQGLW